MAGYSRQSVADIISGEVVKAAPLNAEFNALRDAFAFAGGHNHDGSGTEGSYVGLIADTDGNNKVVVDTSNNRVSIYTEVSSSPVEQIRIQDGAIVPVTDDDIDLGASGAEFKNLWIDGTANIDALVSAAVTLTGGTIDGTVIGGTTPAAGSFTTVSSSGGITGDLTGDVTGDLTGDVTGNLTGNVTGNVTGDVTGNLTGDVTGNVTGNLTGGVTGNVVGNLTGNVTSSPGLSTFNNVTVTGTLTSDLTGDVTGNVTGNLTGNVTGNVLGNVTGTVSDISNHDTDALSEGSTNLYYTDERVDDRVNNLLVAGGNVSLTYDDAANTLTINSTDTGILNVVEDTTPQLGGNLSTNSYDIQFADNDVAAFGAGGDLQIYHDASNSYISERGTGNLYLGTNANIEFFKHLSTDRMAKFITDGAVELYHANSKKIETTSSGVEVTGTATATAFSGPLTGDVTSTGTSSFGTLTTSGNATIGGDLTVNGTTTTLSTTNTTVSDTLMELGNGTTGTPINDSGIVIERGSENNAFIGYDESADKFTVGTGTFTGASTGDLTITTGTLVADIEGDVTGNLTGDVTGDVTGNLSGDVTGDVTGNVTGDLTGNVSGTTVTASGTVQFGSISDGTITITGFVDEDDMSSNSATLIPTQQSVEARIQAVNGTANNVTGLTATGAELNAVADVSAITPDTSTAITSSDAIAMYDASGPSIGYFDVDLLDTYYASTTQTLTNKSIDGSQLTGSVATARLDVGTSGNQLVQLDGSARLPAVDGSQLTNLPSAGATAGFAIAMAIAL